MAHPNEDLIRQGYEAFGKGDLQKLGELFTPDVIWHAPGRNPISGDYKGQEEVFGVFGKIAELTGGTFKLDIHDVLANDTHGVALVTATGQRGGKSLSDNQVNVFHIEDGKVAEFWAHPGDQYAIDEWWS
jgi:ketosteroid isomerase-like protein